MYIYLMGTTHMEVYMKQALATLLHVKSEEKQNFSKNPTIPINKIDPNKTQIKVNPVKTKT
jgi:hypothetical protein